jgi:hypothetical protein
MTARDERSAGGTVIRALKMLWARWKAIAHVIGNFQARVVLSVFYFVVFGPFGVAVRLFGDPLDIRGSTGPRWLERAVPGDVVEAATRQS